MRTDVCRWPTSPRMLYTGIVNGAMAVADRALIKSLNGEWQLKVGDKIGDHATPVPAADVPAPFRTFLTQYDTYLLRYKDIAE